MILDNMDIQQFNSKLISITKIRRDIDALEKVLFEEKEAVVVRNQDVLFVAMTPARYQELQPADQKKVQIEDITAKIDKIRQKYGTKRKQVSASDFVIKMRDERAEKWKDYFSIPR